MLQFKNYKKCFEQTEIVSVNSMSLEHGIYWLRGENGSGKTTIMKSVAGLIPYKGDITVCDKNIRQDRIGYTSIVNYSEAEPLYPGFLTGIDLIRFFEKAKNAPSGQSEHLSKAFGIDSYKGNRVATYSSGMAKKLSLVLGFLGNPKLILLDEPLITLDTQSVAVLQKLIQDYHRQASFIITSHQEVTTGTHSLQHLHIANKTLTSA